MKIAFVNQPFDGVIPPHQNSIGIWTYQVARRLANTHDITVYAKWMQTQKHNPGDIPLTYHLIRSLPNTLIARLSQWLSRLYPSAERPFFASILYYLDYSLQIAWHLRRQAFDIIHIHNFTQFVPIIRAFNPQAKIILHMNCEWLSQLDKTLMQKRLAAVDLVLGSSDHITNKVRQRFPTDASQCHTVFNGVDTDVFIQKNGSTHNRLLFVGRVSPEKGVHLLIDAFVQIAEQLPELHLDIVGPAATLPAEFIMTLSDDPALATLLPFYEGGDYLTQLQTRIPSHLTSRVSFWGAQPHTQIVERYHKCDILINPSYSESFGMSLVEAMASQKPVIASRVGGMVEIVAEGKTGLLIKQGDVSALAEAIVQLIGNEVQRQEMGIAGRQRVLSHFSWEQVAKSLAYHYGNCYE